MKQILLIIDVQKGFTRRPHTFEMGEKIEALLEKKLFDVVISTQFVNIDNSPFTNYLHWHRLKEDDETALFSNVIETASDYVFQKNTYTAFTDDLETILKQENDGTYPEHIFLLGIDTDCCVLATATDLFDHGIRPIVLAEYCASNGGERSHDAAKICLNRLIGKHHIIEQPLTSKTDIVDILETVSKK